MGNVRPELGDKVLEAVAEWAYVPNSSAQVLKGKPSNSVALIISEVDIGRVREGCCAWWSLVVS